jgi:hypothetical protein
VPSHLPFTKSRPSSVASAPFAFWCLVARGMTSPLGHSNFLPLSPSLFHKIQPNSFRLIFTTVSIFGFLSSQLREDPEDDICLRLTAFNDRGSLRQGSFIKIVGKSPYRGFTSVRQLCLIYRSYPIDHHNLSLTPFSSAADQVRAFTSPIQSRLTSCRHVLIKFSVFPGDDLN